MKISFQPPQKYSSKEYELLPFRFSRLDNGQYFLSTDYGEWMCLEPRHLHSLTKKEKIDDESVWFELKSKHFVCNHTDDNQISFLASRYKTKKSFLESFSQLHIFVLTVRCNNSCVYCHDLLPVD